MAMTFKNLLESNKKTWRNINKNQNPKKKKTIQFVSIFPFSINRTYESTKKFKALMEQPSDKTSQEQARESLIEIAYTSPEEEEIITSSDVKPVISITNGNGGGTKRNNDDAEKLRAELISISYDESPSPSPDVDVAVSPTLPGSGTWRG